LACVKMCGKLVKVCLQQCVQYVSNDANTKTKKVIIMRFVSPVYSLRNWYRKMWRFKSFLPHHVEYESNSIRI